MGRFLHSVTTPEQAISADGLYQYDLAVNPLSAVLLVLRPLNSTGTITDFASYLGICGALNRVTIFFRGESIFSMSGRDAAALAYFRHGISPMQANHDDLNNARRCIVLPIILGSDPYSPKSCFPASKRGELSVELDIDIADTGYDGVRLSIESIEILGAKPSEYERKVTATQTFAATGDNDIALPIGNIYRGVLAFGTTGFAGATPVPTLGRMSVRLDNQEMLYAATDFEVAHMLPSLWGRQPPTFDMHTHRVDATAAVTTQETLGGPINVGSGGWENYAFLDFDPMKNDQYNINTKNASSFYIRSNAESANLVRAISVERIKV